MIVSRLKGQLGNQMFQYAAGRALAERHATELVLDTSWILQARRGGVFAPYDLGCFDHGAQVRPVWEVARVPNPRRWVRAAQYLRPSRRRFVRIVEEDSRTNAFVPEVLTAPDDTYLLGYFQFEDYFADQVAAIREAFALPEPGPETRRLEEAIRDVPTVAVHVRRADYTRADLLGFLDEEYYRRGIERIASEAGDVHVVVFSDEPEWCKEHLRLGRPTTVVDRALPRERAWEDLYLMTRCRHHVISNSTFGWWGAWLNPAPDKLVVAPSRWTLGGRRVGDPVPDRWIRV